MNKSVSLANTMTFKQWVEDLNYSLPNLNIPLVFNKHDNWKIWVMNFISVNPKHIITLPTQEHWQDWVSFFINDINAI